VNQLGRVPGAPDPWPDTEDVMGGEQLNQAHMQRMLDTVQVRMVNELPDQRIDRDLGGPPGQTEPGRVWRDPQDLVGARGAAHHRNSSRLAAGASINQPPNQVLHLAERFDLGHGDMPSRVQPQLVCPVVAEVGLSADPEGESTAEVGRKS
jgi:hypothetical protein